LKLSSISRSGWLIAAVSLYIVLALNLVFWAKLYDVIAPQTLRDWLFFSEVLVVLFGIHILFLTLFATPYVLKPVAAVLLITAAVISYFMAEYGTVIDAGMVHNALQTDAAETRDLITPGAVLYVAALGLVPAAAVIWLPLHWPGFGAYFRANVVRGTVAGFVVAAVFALSAGTFVSVFRENRSLLLSLAPANVISAVTEVANRTARRSRGPLVIVGADAHVEQTVGTGMRPRVTVVVVGETARAQNFSLFGYSRDTNPRLAAVPDLLAFSNASSCGTETAVSVPCMFSNLGRQEFSIEEAAGRENLLDVVKRAGRDVLWRENQSGCKGVCNRVASEMLTKATDPKFCASGECHDEILVDGLEDRIEAMRSGGVIVLHMMGSHGPAYYKRVPERFVNFKPVCQSSQFSKCTTDELVNSYDNTILYSDYVLSKVIEVLDRSAKAGFDTAMFYVSDHGESLGEKGLYLHAMPYALAPKQQTHVPLLIWLSEGAKASLGLDGACLAAAAKTQPVSHDNLFHTVLGLQGIRTDVYRSELDMTADCRRQPHVQAQ
jgi:lipid A ethanolaminephosphotransferase